MIAVVSLALSTAGLLLGCAGQTTPSGARSQAATRQAFAASDAQGRKPPAATISDRDGPSWSGRLGDTVQVDWYDQTSGKTLSERIAVLSVRRLPNPGGTTSPTSSVTPTAPTSGSTASRCALPAWLQRTARTPIAYQFLSLSDGSYSEDGVAGLGSRRGPDPSRVGKSSVGWLYQWTDDGFRPTEVLMPIGAWQARWSLD